MTRRASAPTALVARAGHLCAACGRNLADVERLPTARELAAAERSSPPTSPPTGASVADTVREFLETMRADGNPGTAQLPCAKPRAFRRTPQITGWIVLPVDREDVEKPHRYEPGLLLSVDGTFHRLDSELRGWGQRDFPRYEQRVSPSRWSSRPTRSNTSSTRWPQCPPRTQPSSA